MFEKWHVCTATDIIRASPCIGKKKQQTVYGCKNTLDLNSQRPRMVIIEMTRATEKRQ